MLRRIGQILSDLEDALIDLGVPEEKAQAFVDELENRVDDLASSYADEDQTEEPEEES